ncbi:MAG: DUF1538 domain-containing protein [Dermatophilaceae bacterium]|jgi:hypothetical protein|uniref:DUF1538 domain-containing protein n=1 Tax=Candidatus Phosphoribacter hodrii TaxID=2953743 RepID=A0A934X640_9MICO|nr:DUF1538 domain-containing protein [Candidatus Phosphoribacter hodrii]MBP8837575.1 DUF1538 domain-containing protein [Dermatophilaceae bacterium]
MIEPLVLIRDTLLDTLVAVLPIALLIVFFQRVVIRRPIPDLSRILVGFVLLVVGMVLFLAGLGEALFPLGRVMASQLTSPDFIGVPADAAPHWRSYWAVYVFGALIGFATTVAEPALIAVSMKAALVSGGTVSSWGLRIVVAIGVAIGIALGCFRIVTGTSLPAYIIVGYVLVSFQAMRAPRSILALAFDTGGVTTSTVTVPLVAALGLGLASTIPGRSPLADGFGLIAFASLFPMMTVMGYAQIGQWRARRRPQPHGAGSTEPAPPTPQEV